MNTNGWGFSKNTGFKEYGTSFMKETPKENVDTNFRVIMDLVLRKLEKVVIINNFLWLKEVPENKHLIEITWDL